MTEETTPKGKNKKMYIMAGATAGLCIILLVISSLMKKEKNKPDSNKEIVPAFQEAPAAPENDTKQNLSDFWDEVDRSNEIVKPKEAVTSVINTLSQMGYISDEEAEHTIENNMASYPPPTFVSSGGDTIVWKNGIYRKFDTLPEPEQKPDTLILNGKTYIELLDEVR